MKRFELSDKIGQLEAAGNCNDPFEHRFFARYATAPYDPDNLQPWLVDAVLAGRQATPSGHQWYDCQRCRGAWRDQ